MDIETISPRPFVMWYPAQTLEILRRDFLPGAKYMDEPKISRYLNERN